MISKHGSFYDGKNWLRSLCEAYNGYEGCFRSPYEGFDAAKVYFDLLETCMMILVMMDMESNGVKTALSLLFDKGAASSRQSRAAVCPSLIAISIGWW